MSFQVDKQDQYTVVTVTDDKLTAKVAPKLKSELVNLVQDGHTNLILVLSDVQYIDSSGLSAILVGHRTSKEHEGTLVLTGVQESVEKLIKISQLDSILQIMPTLQEAIDKALIKQADQSGQNGNESSS